MEHIERHRLVGMKLLLLLFIGVMTESPEEDQASIEREFGRSFSDVVRLNYWSVFERGDEFADELGISRARLDALVAKHSWELKPPPALAFQNALDSSQAKGLERIKASSRQGLDTGAFVGPSGKAPKSAAYAEIRCDGGKLSITVTCPDPNPGRWKAITPLVDDRPEKVKAFWSGDFATLKPLIYPSMTRGQEVKWALGLPKPTQSVLLDECVVVYLTPVGVGRDWSNFELIHLAPDPEELRSQLKPRPASTNRVFMEGAYYFIAVNPNGALLDVFYDPWGGGTMSPAWKSKTKATATRSEKGWKVAMEIPWDSLRPTAGKDSVWGVDVSHLRRGNTGPAEVSRTVKTSLVHYDLDRNSGGFRIAHEKAVEKADGMPPLSLDLAMVGSIDWSKATRIDSLTDRSGRSSDRTNVRLMHDDSNLYLRFECEEQSLDLLKVVTREEEDKAYGKGNRRTHFIDRRESWGIDWGDYVEVLLSPDLSEADPYHAGSFQFMVNSDGVLLQRHYDSFGMFTVMPHPEWDSGTKVKVDKNREDNRWAVELTIPFSALCGPGQVPGRWGLNLHRCVSGDNARATDSAWIWKNDQKGKLSRGDELNLFWSVPAQVIRDPAHYGWMVIDPRKTKAVANGGTRPDPAPGREVGSGKPTTLKRDRSGDRLDSVNFVDETHGWAAGGLGTILHTSDGGDTWKEQETATHFFFEKVFFIDRKHGWAVGGWPRDYEVAIKGGMGVILATTDGGTSWETQLDSAGSWLTGLTFLDQENGWAVGEFGTVWRTQDGGGNWNHMRKAPTPAWLYDVHFIDKKRGWTVGRFETAMSTEDGGESWTKQPMPALRRPYGLSLNYRAVRFASPSEGWIVGQHGNILHTGDGGKSWTREKILVNEKIFDLINLSDLSVSGDNQVWAVSQFGLLQRVATSGSWKVTPTGTTGWWRSVHFTDPIHGWVTGDRGTVITTSDGGRNWRKQLDSGRQMGVLYGTPHDHHVNGSAMVAVGEHFDSAYLLMGRSANKPFQIGGDVNTHKTDAVTTAMGITVGYNFNEFSWQGRDSPHLILERYQHHRGLKEIEQRLVAAIRCLKPLVVVGEQPVMQEGYYAHGVGDVARAMIAAYESAGDPKRFPELAELGLKPYAPKKLYLATMWPNPMYDVHPRTLRLPPRFGRDDRLGRTREEATLEGRQVFWGLLDRGRPPETQKPWPGSWSLHLKDSKVEVPSPEKNIFDGIK